MNSDMDNKTDDDEKIEYYNEYVMRPMPTCLGWINYFLYFPVNLMLIIIFKDFHIVETQSPNKLAYYTIMPDHPYPAFVFPGILECDYSCFHLLVDN